MLNDSVVEIELGGEKRELQCTLDAVAVMSKAYGGLTPLFERVKQLDLEAFTIVVRAGLMVDGAEAKNLMETIYSTGMVNLQPAVAEYVLLCAAGGIRPKNDESTDSGKP